METKNDEGPHARNHGTAPEHEATPQHEGVLPHEAVREGDDIPKHDRARADVATMRKGRGAAAAAAFGVVAERADRFDQRTNRRSLAEKVRSEMGERRGPRAWIPAFLVLLEYTANVRLACYAAGIGRQNVYKLREHDPAFRAAWDAAVEIAADRLEEEAWRRAYDGIERYMVSHGKVTTDENGRPMVELHYSDMLLDRLLRAHRPQKYRETAAQNEVQTVVKVYSGFDPDKVGGPAERGA